jgi:hypothetical protein
MHGAGIFTQPAGEKGSLAALRPAKSKDKLIPNDEANLVADTFDRDSSDKSPQSQRFLRFLLTPLGSGVFREFPFRG